MKLLGENIEENILNFRISIDFLNRTQKKTQTIKK